MKHLDLFSGIGGFALAVDTVWPDSTHTFVEIDQFCQEVLKKHWPNAEIYGDIRTLTAHTQHNGITTTEGLGANSQTQSESSTRQELFKSESQGVSPLRTPETGWDLLTGGFPCQPFSQAGRKRGTEDDRYLWPEMLRVIKEFKPAWIIGENVAGIVNMVLDQVCLDLEAEGYEVQPIIIPAVSLNAPHRRDRVWIVAYRKSGQSRKQTEQKGREDISRANSDVTNTRRARTRSQEEPERLSGDTSRWSWSRNWFEVATELCRMDDGLPKRLDRNLRLKALGNAIVSQIAIEIMKGIRDE